MPVQVIRLFNDKRGFRWPSDPPSGPPRSLGSLREAFLAWAARGEAWIEFGGLEPTAYPDLPEAIALARQAGLGVRMVTTAVDRLGAQGLAQLQKAGLSQIVALFMGDDAVHDALIGREGALAKTLEVLGSGLEGFHLLGRLLLHREALPTYPDLLPKLHHKVARLQIHRLGSAVQDPERLRHDGVNRKQTLATIERLWALARPTDLPLDFEGFATWPDAAPVGQAEPVDDTLWSLLFDDIPLPGVLASGTQISLPPSKGFQRVLQTARGLSELGLTLAAMGAPALDLPQDLGGLGLMQAHEVASLDPEAHRGLPAHQGVGANARMAVVVGATTDGLFALDTAPALTFALRERGLDVVLHNLLLAPTNPYAPSPRPTDSLRADAQGFAVFPPALAASWAIMSSTHAWAFQHREAWLASLDFSDRDVVLVAGWEDALAIWRHPTLRDDARVIIADFHMRQGLGKWFDAFLKPGQLSMDGGWWPSERLLVHSVFPRSAREYWRSGIPMRQILWRPYPVGLSWEGTAHDGSLLAIGNHQRDWTTLARAAEHAKISTIGVHSRLPVPTPLQDRGELRLLLLYQAIARARAILVPIAGFPDQPAGISVISMALSAGKPVISTASTATHAHIQHGIDGWLTRPRGVLELSEVLTRTQEDPAWLDGLTQGARATRASLGVGAWADAIVFGTAPQRIWPLQKNGPWMAWPRA